MFNVLLQNSQVQNLVLEVILATLMVSQSPRVTVGFISMCCLIVRSYYFSLIFFCVQLSPHLILVYCANIQQINIFKVLKYICILKISELRDLSFTLSPWLFLQEISLGIIGNLACHEVSRKQIASVKGLVEIIVDQLFVDDTPCLCEEFRYLLAKKPDFQLLVIMKIIYYQMLIWFFFFFFIFSP